jgi:hypothetical protein
VLGQLIKYPGTMVSYAIFDDRESGSIALPRSWKLGL